VQAAVSGGEGAGPTFGGESSCRSERDEVEGNSAGAGESEGEDVGAGEGVGEGESGFVVEDFSALFSGEMAQSLQELAGILYTAQCGVQRSTAAE
jgi:hypothetical protein